MCMGKKEMGTKRKKEMKKGKTEEEDVIADNIDDTDDIDGTDSTTHRSIIRSSKSRVKRVLSDDVRTWSRVIKEYMSKYYIPSENITVDEQLVSLQGRCSFK